MILRPAPPFDPKLIFVQAKAKDYPLYQEMKESFAGASFEKFEGRHDAIPILIQQNPNNFLKAKKDLLILEGRNGVFFNLLGFCFGLTIIMNRFKPDLIVIILTSQKYYGGDGVRVAYPLFQRGDGGAIPTSPLQFHIYESSA